MTAVKKNYWIKSIEVNQHLFCSHVRKNLYTIVVVDFREQCLWEMEGREAGPRFRNSCSSRLYYSSISSFWFNGL